MTYETWTTQNNRSKVHIEEYLDDPNEPRDNGTKDRRFAFEVGLLDEDRVVLRKRRFRYIAEDLRGHYK